MSIISFTDETRPGPLKLSGSFRRDRVTRGQVTALGEQATQFEGLRGRVNADIRNAPEREGRRLRSAGGLAVQQKFGDQQTGAVTQGDVLSNALKRAKARVGIGNRGDAAIRNQQLKDRLTQVRSGIRAKGRAINLQVTGQNIQAGVNVGVGNAQARGRASTADAFGTSVGAIAATIGGNKTRTGSFFNFGDKKSPIFDNKTNFKLGTGGP